MATNNLPPGFEDMTNFPLMDALLGRRARRVAMGSSTPEGPLHFVSDKEPVPLTDLEKLTLLTAMSGDTGWNYLIMGNPRYAPHLSNYACAAPGRTFPSAAGFHTTELFFTDDTGVYFFLTRDNPPPVEVDQTGAPDIQASILAHQSRIRKLADGRMHIPREEPFIEGHNLWIANVPGSLLIIPVGDLAQHALANLCYYLQNGYVIFDDINKRQIPGIERFSDIADTSSPIPMSFIDQWGFGEVVTELACACYAGTLMLQAMGLGGWLFNGLNPFAILGASGDPRMPGLGFRYDTDDRWPLPNPTGLPGVFEAYCPPNYPDMASALEALITRKFGPNGPFNPETPGQWTDTPKIRSAAQPYSDHFKACVTLQAQYVLDTFGKYPATTPSTLCLPYLQAHHLDLDFYDKHFKPGAYLETHARHMERWH